MRISDWSSDVCSSDLHLPAGRHAPEVMVTGGGCRPGHRRVRPLWVDLKLSLYCCGYAPATRDCVTSQLHSRHPRLRIPEIKRTLPDAPRLFLKSEMRRVGKGCVSRCRYRWSREY